MTECPGLAPEEVESLVTTPLETSLIGTTGVEALRSSSVVGLSTVVVEFAWDSDLYRSRQIVFERIQKAVDELPEGVFPQLTPVSSIMGQILTLAVYSESGQTSPMDLRSVAEWDIRRKLLSHSGVSEVFCMGGERRQYQVQLRPEDLLRFGITVDEVEEALQRSNRNVTGGFLTQQGPKQFLVRSIGRIKSIDDLSSLTVKGTTDPPILLSQVADVVEGASVAVGDSSAAIKSSNDTIIEGPAVVLTVEKQLNQDARTLTTELLKEAESLQEKLREKYPDITIVPLYQQKTYVELAVSNVLSALRDGAFLVAIVVFIFLASFRTTFVTLVTIPTTIATTCLVFAGFGLSINTMTLGGLAVAIGELVDDAIVDVENINRRLLENAKKGSPLSTLDVVFGASSEIRKSVVNGTLITILVFFPIFFLQGIEGKLFAPLGLAYVVSLGSSLLVSLTLTPALSHWILNRRFTKQKLLTNQTPKSNTSILLSIVQNLAGLAIKLSLKNPGIIISCAIGLGLAGILMFLSLERDFMPAFNEGAIQVNLDLTPGTSLQTSSELATHLEEELIKIEGIDAVVRKTGRSEMDEHTVPVNTSEFICSVDRTYGRNFDDIVDDVRQVINTENIPGTITSYDQPLQHLLNHLRSGTSAKIAIKLNSENLMSLRNSASEIQELLEDVEDVGSLRADPIQADLPQVQIRLKRDALAKYGLTPEDVDRTIAISLNGSIATKALEGERPIEVLTRLGNNYREDLEQLRRLSIRLPQKENTNTLSGSLLENAIKSADSSESSVVDLSASLDSFPTLGSGVVPLSELADIDIQAQGPGQIDRENGRRQVVIQSNPRKRGAVEVKEDIEEILLDNWDALTANGVDLRIAGLFESEENATKTLLALSCLSGLAIFLLLFKMFRSVNLALQVMAIVPLALVGAVAALTITGQSRTIPSLIGMISLCGVASRNGILLLERYLHLVQYEGEKLTQSMVLRAGRERVAPVLMTALTSIIGLIPLSLAPNLPGREFLYPIATVMIGGLITSTALEFFVRPALFWNFGLKAAARYIERETSTNTSESLSEVPPKFES